MNKTSNIKWFKKDELAKRLKRVTVPTCNIGRAVSLNIVSSQYIPPPTKVKIGLDSEERLLIIAEDRDHGEIKVEAVNKGKSGRIVSRPLIQWLKNNGVRPKKYKGEYDPELKVLVFSLGKME